MMWLIGAHAYANRKVAKFCVEKLYALVSYALSVIANCYKSLILLRKYSPVSARNLRRIHPVQTCRPKCALEL